MTNPYGGVMSASTRKERTDATSIITPRPANVAPVLKDHATISSETSTPVNLVSNEVKVIWNLVQAEEQRFICQP